MLSQAVNWGNIPPQRHLELNRLCKQLLLTYSKSWFEIDLKICKQLFSAFLQKHNLWKYKHIILLVIYFNIKRIKIDFITSSSICIVFLTSVLYGYAVFLIDMVSLSILQIFYFSNCGLQNFFYQLLTDLSSGWGMMQN